MGHCFHIINIQYHFCKFYHNSSISVIQNPGYFMMNLHFSLKFSCVVFYWIILQFSETSCLTSSMHIPRSCWISLQWIIIQQYVNTLLLVHTYKHHIIFSKCQDVYGCIQASSAEKSKFRPFFAQKSPLSSR